jgi:hypothetical protein
MYVGQWQSSWTSGQFTTMRFNFKGEMVWGRVLFGGVGGTGATGLALSRDGQRLYVCGMGTTYNPVSYTHLTLPTTPYV